MNRWFQRIIADHAAGDQPERLLVVAPSIVAAGEKFDITVSALDKLGYPSVECDGRAVLADGPADCDESALGFQDGQPAAGKIEGLSFEQAGIYRLRGKWGDDMFVSNPIVCEARPSQRLYWGDPHIHTVLSDCSPRQCRSLDFCYVASREVIGLDWAAAADHVSNGRSSVGKWQAQRAAARIFNDPPEFVTILGYEASLKGGCGGDNNVYFAGDADQWFDEYEDGDVGTLSEELADYDCIIVPHHTTRTGKHGELTDRLYLGPNRMPVVEIHSKWGTSEYRGNPNPLEKIHPGPSYVQDYLRQGYPMGFIGGTDTHSTMPAGHGVEHLTALPGMTAVWSEDLTRRGIYDNIGARNCYAASGERIIINDAEIAGSRPGREIDWPDADRPRSVTATVAAKTDIVSVDIVRNGQAVHSQAADGWKAEIDWTDSDGLSDIAFPPRGGMDAPFVYYYLRVTARSGAQAWSSPVWLLL